ncbi:growth hormone releasing hormone receptor, isoform CRA_d [Rattus norvegicus]|uniref:Growth hormone releasing hormone receptor, isoform CRA_d n=2 Tax=Rattus norvegicus TaxID=10116 RepID=A6K0Y1_RAT|nr:growth hormone releasing hormone receptor, isoform CRA_d [Rattus norvegicus]
MQLGGIARDSLGGKGHGSLGRTTGTTAMDSLLWATWVLCLLNLWGVAAFQINTSPYPAVWNSLHHLQLPA